MSSDPKGFPRVLKEPNFPAVQVHPRVIENSKKNKELLFENKKYYKLRLGDKEYWREEKPFAQGSTGAVYNIYPINVKGELDKGIPLAVKYYHKGLIEGTRIYEEEERQGTLFDSRVYRLDQGQFVMLMPRLPGEPILKYDEKTKTEIPHEKLKDLSLIQRLELAVVILQAYAEFYADRVDRGGLRHTDLHPKNILIEIKIDKEGRAFFQCNIIDFANYRARSIETMAPEDQGKSDGDGEGVTIQMAIYSLTPTIVAVFGETEPFRLKEGIDIQEVGGVTKRKKTDYYFLNMWSYLIEASNGFFDKNKHSNKNLLKEMIMASLKDYGLAQNELDIIQRLSDRSKSDADFICQLIFNTVVRMGTQNSEHRPQDFLVLAKIFNIMAVSLREYEYECRSSIAKIFSAVAGDSRSFNMASKEPAIPNRYSLFTQLGLVQHSSDSQKNVEKDVDDVKARIKAEGYITLG